MSDNKSSISHSKSHSHSHSRSRNSDSRYSSSHRHSRSYSERSYSSKSSRSYSSYSRSRSRDHSRDSSRGVGLPKIFITKLKPYVRESDIEKEFEQFGKIKNINLKRTFAFVEYYNKDDAREAIRKLDNKKLFGQQERVVVEEAIGNRRDRDKKRYSRSRDRYRDRGRYKDRYYDRDRYNRYKKNDSYPKHRYRKTGPKPTDICFNCHGYGHWANECQMPSKSKKPYQSGRSEPRSPYSSNSLDRKAKKQDYLDKKDKNPVQNIDHRNNKSEPAKDQTDRDNFPDPPKPVEDKPLSD